MSELRHTLVLPMLLLVSLVPQPARATLLTSTVSTGKLAVGDRIRLNVNIVAPKEAVITPPATEQGFGNILVKEWNVHKAEGEKNDSSTYEYILTTYTPEPCTIPRLAFVIEQNGTGDTLYTDSIPLKVISVLPSDTVDLMGLKPPLSAGKAPKWWLWVLGIVVGIVAIVAGYLYLSKRLRKVPPPPPPVPPYEEAIEALLTLGVKKYLQRGLVREYVFELSEIFKRYIGRRFECNGVEFTTEEMVAWCQAANLPKKQRAAIEWFFRTTDPVKFARMIPDSTTIERFDREVRDFLEATRPVLQKDEPPVEVTDASPSSPAIPAADKEENA